MAVSLTMMIGRIGALTGNVMFPVFLGIGCTIAVSVLGVIQIGKMKIAIISCLKTNFNFIKKTCFFVRIREIQKKTEILYH